MLIESLEQPMHHCGATRTAYKRVDASRRYLDTSAIAHVDDLRVIRNNESRVSHRVARAAVENSHSAVQHLSDPRFCPIKRGHFCRSSDSTEPSTSQY